MILPVLHFAENEPSWETRTLGSISTSFSGGTPTSSNQEYYNGSIPFIRSGEINNNSTELYITQKGLDNSSAHVVNKGTILYALYGATSGEVEISHIQGAINQAILAIFPNEKIIDKHYLVQYLRANKEAIISTYLQGGQGNLSGAIVKSIAIQYPKSLTSQKKIAAILDGIDKQIQLESINLGKKKQIKSACLQSMFPQEGESVPKVRFKGFNEEWERCNLSDIATFRKGKGYSKSDIVSHGKPIILYGSLYTNYNLKISEINSFVHEKVGSYKSEGNEIIVPASGETAEDIARASVVAQKGVILGGDLNIICVDKNSFIPEFIALSITYGEPHKSLTKVAQGKSVVHLHNSDLSKICLLCPSLEEQQQIAAYFENLDKQISLQTQRLEKLKQIKSACLDKMFV